MKIKFIIIAMILSIASTQYAMKTQSVPVAPVKPTGYSSPKEYQQHAVYKPVPEAKLLYKAQLAALRSPNNNITKNNSILRALTGTASYKDGNGGTIVFNKITGAITFKDAQGKATRQLSKNLNGTTSEVVFNDPYITPRKTFPLFGQIGHKIDTNIPYKTTTTYQNENNPLGVRTVTTNKLDGSDGYKTETINFNANNNKTSSNRQTKVSPFSNRYSRNQSYRYDLQSGEQVKNNILGEIHNEISNTGKSAQQFNNEKVTGLAGSVLKYPFTKSTAAQLKELQAMTKTTTEAPVENSIEPV